jgi:O-antigen/teichoic acid export membrane protein
MIKQHLKTIFKNSLWSFGDQTIGLVIGFIVSPLISRLLPPESRGIFTLVFLVPGMITQFIVLGIPSSNIYFYASKKIDDLTLDKVNFYFGSVLSIIGVIINLIIAFSLKSTFYNEVPFNYILLSTISIPISIYTSFLMSTLGAKQLFKKIAIFSTSIYILNFALTLAVFFYYKEAMFLLILLTIFVSVINLVILILITKPRIIHNNSSITSYLKIALRYGVPAHLSNVVTYLNYRADQYLVSYLLGNTSLGLYSVAVGLSEKLWMFSSTISGVAFPKLSELFHDINAQNKISLLLARWIFIASFIGAVIMAILFPFYIKYAHGVNYIASIPLFLIMLPGIVMWGTGRIFANSLASMGKTKPNLYIAITTFILNFSLNLILLPAIGVIGASIATLIAYTTDTLLKGYFYCKLTNQRLSDLFKLLPEEKRFLKSFPTYQLLSKN